MRLKALERFKDPRNNPMYGKIRITDGVENKIIDSNLPIPDGWNRGITRHSKRK